jgi:hypothetical protein
MHAELGKLNAIMSKIMATPFVPQGRFGDYALVVKKKVWDPKTRGTKQIVVRQQHFRYKWQRDQAQKRLAKSMAKSNEYILRAHDLEGYSKNAIMIPGDLLETVAMTGEFSEDQLEILADVATATRWHKLEARYEALLSKVEGAETDLLRNFSNFIWHNANYTWKSEFKPAFGQIRRAEANAIKVAEKNALADPARADLWLKQADFLRRNAAIMERTEESVLRPESEYQGARMVVSMLYLGYNVVTAVLNATSQILTVNALTSQFGEARGIRLMGQAYSDTMQLMRLTDRIAQAKGDELRRLNNLKMALDQAKQEGILDQSYAYFLAGQANGFDMARAFKRSKAGRLTHVALEMGMLPFRLVELGNRYVSFTAFFNAQFAETGSYAKAYEYAVQQTNLTQNSFDQANKPEMLRGKKSILFVFASFAQFMMYHAAGGYERQARAQNREAIDQAKAQGKPVPRRHASWWHGETAKLYAIYLMLAGLSGVPFGEDLLNLANLFWKKVFGYTENVKDELRKYFESMDMDADLIMHGFTHDVGGFDLSGRMGLGRLVPFASALGQDYRSPEEALGKSLIVGAGPAGGAAADLVKVGSMMLDDARGVSGATKAEMAKEMPGVIGGLGRAIDAHNKQLLNPTYGVTTRNGERIVRDLNSGEFRDLSGKELVGMGFGLTPTVVSQNRERNRAEDVEFIYWTTRRGTLLHEYNRAKFTTRDPEAIDDMRRAIDQFNDVAPAPALRITGKTLADSGKAYRANVRGEENRSGNSRAERQVKREVQEGYVPAGARGE